MQAVVRSGMEVGELATDEERLTGPGRCALT